MALTVCWLVNQTGVSFLSIFYHLSPLLEHFLLKLSARCVSEIDWSSWVFSFYVKITLVNLAGRVLRLFQKQLPKTGQVAKSDFPRDSPTRVMFARTFQLIKIAEFLQWLRYKNL